MVAFWEWMEKPATENICSYFAVISLGTLLSALVLYIFLLLGATPLNTTSPPHYKYLIGPIIEEFLFRWLPMFVFFCLFAVFGFKKSKKQITALVIIITVSSLLFGLMHGGAWIQTGISGAIFFFVYLKSGGLRKQHIRAVIASSTTHALFNLLYAPFVISYYI